MKCRYVLITTFLACLWSPVGAEPIRIVTLGAGVTETVFALGMGEQVVGVDVSSLFPEEAQRKPKVGYVRQTSAEGIASLKPSLVLASEILGPPAIKEQLKSAGLRLELIPAAKSIDDALTRIKSVGKVLNKETEANALAAAVQSKIDEAKKITRKQTQKNYLVHYYRL